jgi:hypothetical protein
LGKFLKGTDMGLRRLECETYILRGKRGIKLAVRDING